MGIASDEPTIDGGARTSRRARSFSAAVGILAGLALVLLSIACGSTGRSPAEAPLRYVALGDSYTIGTALEDRSQRWPNQLVAALGAGQPAVTLTRNLGADAYTSRDLIEVELPQLDALEPDFVTLLIGVNDVVQGVPPATYRSNLRTIFGALRKRLPAHRILVVTTPDYTVTPSGGEYGNPVTERAGIEASNRIIEEVATARGIGVVDIFDLSQRAGTNRSLVAADGLHPSGSQYALWIARIAPKARQLLTQH